MEAEEWNKCELEEKVSNRLRRRVVETFRQVNVVAPSAPTLSPHALPSGCVGAVRTITCPTAAVSSRFNLSPPLNDAEQKLSFFIGISQPHFHSPAAAGMPLPLFQLLPAPPTLSPALLNPFRTKSGFTSSGTLRSTDEALLSQTEFRQKSNFSMGVLPVAARPTVASSVPQRQSPKVINPFRKKLRSATVITSTSPTSSTPLRSLSKRPPIRAVDR